MTQDVTVRVSYTWKGPALTLEEHAQWLQTQLSPILPYDLKCEPVGMATYEEVAHG